MAAALDRALARSAGGEPLDAEDILAILLCDQNDLPALLERSRELRDEGRAALGLEGVVTYSRKVFIPLTRLCRYRCSYCTFVTPRVSAGSEFMTLDEVLDVARSGREWGCTEALFTLGEGPEHRHPEAREWLESRGFASTVEYLAYCQHEVVRRTGLLPHTNPGAVTAGEMRLLRDSSASQGVMMEQLSDRLLQAGEAHAGAAGKAAAVRLGQLSLAAATRTPFTTGFLIGIGETLAERAGTIARIRDADEGQIQEVIVQNFRAKPGTPMRAKPDAEEPEMVRAIAATRLALGSRASVQAPPNLTPRTYGQYLDAGINDWGGVSPVTPDHVNPEMPWPSLDELAETCERRGFTLRQRLPVYPQYLNQDWISKPMWRHVLAASDAMGLAREERWYAGESWTPVLRAAQPEPKRRALAIASSKPEMTAMTVSDHARVRATGYGAPPQETVGFDEMLPDTVSRTVMPWERADLVEGLPGHPWLAPYTALGSRVRPKPDVVGLALALGSRVRPKQGRSDRGGSAPPNPPASSSSLRLRSVLAKAHQGERLDHAEVELLLRAEGADLEALVSKADEIRREMRGDEVSFVVNRNITYTNFCHTGCGFCGFARPLGHEDGYYFEPEQVGAKALEAWRLGATEVCVQGGIHPHNTGAVYLEIARAIKDAAPRIHLHGFSPLEITVGARTLELPLERFLPQLKEAGVDSIPGTAAEVLDTRVRPLITPQKLSAIDWIDLMRSAHRAGIRATTTIMFGHVDDPAAWATHLLALRDLQAETGGFTELVPLPFVHHRSPIFMRGESRTGPTWRECVKMHAVGRVVLHPLIPNIQASWVKLGVSGVVALLEAGVNDFGGTLMEEHISRMAGASHGLGLTVDDIEAAIRRAGRIPRERTTTYGVAEPAYRERVAAGV